MTLFIIANIGIDFTKSAYMSDVHDVQHLKLLILNTKRWFAIFSRFTAIAAIAVTSILLLFAYK